MYVEIRNLRHLMVLNSLFSTAEIQICWFWANLVV